MPPHTDRQDVIVFQTQGAKRWRVYAPPKRQKKKDPLNRGKAGDVLSFEEELDDQPLIDTVLRAGDILYVPTGFPHTTDTCTVVDSDVSSDDMFEDTSVHLTMGLDTHVWALTFAFALESASTKRTGVQLGNRKRQNLLGCSRVDSCWVSPQK